MNGLRTFFAVLGLISASSGLIATTDKGAERPTSSAGDGDTIVVVVAVATEVPGATPSAGLLAAPNRPGTGTFAEPPATAEVVRHDRHESLGLVAIASIGLLLVGAIAFLVARNRRPSWPGQADVADAAAAVRVEGTALLARRTHAVLVAIEGRRILLAVGKGGVSVVDRWSTEDSPAAPPEPLTTDRDGSSETQDDPAAPAAVRDRDENREERTVAPDVAEHHEERRAARPHGLTSEFLIELDHAWNQARKRQASPIAPPAVASAATSPRAAEVLPLRRPRTRRLLSTATTATAAAA